MGYILYCLLPRDAVRKHGFCCHLVYVRPSVTLVIVSRRLKISSNFFPGPVALKSSFLTSNAGTQF